MRFTVTRYALGTQSPDEQGLGFVLAIPLPKCDIIGRMALLTDLTLKPSPLCIYVALSCFLKVEGCLLSGTAVLAGS